MQHVTMYDIVRLVLASVLLIAAGLKGYQLATEPALNTSILDAPWFLIAVVEFELVFGLCLLTNIWPDWTRPAAILCFAVFAAVSLYKALSGAASCGCFGSVAVNPWYTFTMDVAAVLALFWWRPSGAAGSLRIGAVVVAWLVVGVPTAVIMGTYQHSLSTEDGIIMDQNDLIVLEPEKWIGKRCPLLPYIEDAPRQVKPDERDLHERLAENAWIVVLYHVGCPSCQEVIPEYEELARKSGEDAHRPRVALIEVPAYGEAKSERLPSDVPWVLGRLSTQKEWFVETPAVLLLRNGLVNPAEGI